MHHNRQVAARWFSFVIWAAVAASAAAWVLRLAVPARPAPAHATTVDTAASARADLSRLFGVDVVPSTAPPEPAVVVNSSRFKLVGVAAARSPRGAREGVALIAVDGKPARAFRVGAVVDGDAVLQEVRARGASLGPRGGAAAISLEIPALPPPATGSLPMPAPGGMPALQTPPMQPAAPAPLMQAPQPVDAPGQPQS